MADIAAQLAFVKQKMKAAATSAGRSVNDIRLVAVSKTKPEQEIREAYTAGQRLFGENRVQEAKNKFPIVRKEYADIELHLIGPLQTNKAEEAVKLFDVIETLDRPKLAQALADAIKKTGLSPKLYIEVNTGGETQKSGIAPDELKVFLAYCRHERGLTIHGLMCIPPQNEDPVPHFKKLKELAVENSLLELSMGMSSDYETAIACGATSVRVGTAIFGARTANS